MSAKEDMTIPVSPGQSYHIFNRGINRRLIFFEKDNYRYFMTKYIEYMSSYWDTYAWALMTNHFHLVIKVKSSAKVVEAGKTNFKKVDAGFLSKYESLINEIKQNSSSDLSSMKGWNRAIDLSNFENLIDLARKNSCEPRSELLLEALANWTISQRFRRFLLGYAKAINKQQKRTGSLFQKSFRRKVISTNTGLVNAICYVHHNPIHHNYVCSYEQYQWSSYNSYISDDKSSDIYKKATDVFGRLDEMKAQHEVYKSRYKVKFDQSNFES